MKKFSALLLVLLLIVNLFSCSRPGESQVSETPPEPRAETSELSGSLKILSERFCWNCPMSIVDFNHFSPPRDNIANVLFYFQEMYPDVKIEIEYLPTDQEEREFNIKQRRTAMMAGKDVPDIYLMPTLSLTEISCESMEPLFKDVAQAMSNNWFADISGLYNGDTELHTEELNKPVMDAGTIGSARYVLPLGYNIPIYITRKDLLDNAGIDREKLNAGIDSMVDVFMELKERGDPSWAASAYFTSGLMLSLLPRLCDYETEEALIDGKQVESLLMDMVDCTRTTAAEWKRLNESGEEVYGRSISPSLLLEKNSHTKFVADEDSPGISWDVTGAIDAVGSGKFMGYEMEIIPIRASDGTLNAEVTYWGAISAGCENKKLAYEFLRLFLTPEVQHEGQLKTPAKTYEMSFEWTKESINTGPLPGWPVRYKGFAEERWGRVLDGFREAEGYNKQSKEEMLKVTVDDSDLPVLDVPIDSVRFTSSLDQEFYQYIRPVENYDVENYTQADAAKAGNEFVRNLKYHLAEG